VAIAPAPAPTLTPGGLVLAAMLLVSIGALGLRRALRKY
jgi:hypothetical protein